MDPFTWAQEHAALLAALAAASLILVVAGALLGPLFLLRLPHDYFTEQFALRRRERHRATREVLSRVMRNLLGALLLLLGLLLLVLPGQGLLTMIAGLSLLDFPHKQRLLRALVSARQVRRALNWLRRRFRRAPFTWDS